MRSWIYTLLILATAGLAFSGYLSAVKLFTGACALSEPCPYFLGYPACWYGFAMYLVMFIVTAFAAIGPLRASAAFMTDLFVSAIGIDFAGNFALGEFLNGSVTGKLGLSTCVYGLIFFVAIFVISTLAAKRTHRLAA